MDKPFDRRVTPIRDDLAAAFLKGKVDAPRFAEGTPMQVTASVLPIRRTPAADGPQETQALFGETITIFDEQDGWGWGQAAFDGYVGYVDMEGLSAPVLTPTHRVTALRTYRFTAPDLKSAPLGLISRNAKLTAEPAENGFVREARGGFVHAGHTAPIGENTGVEPTRMAEDYQGAPYFWGGRESLGLDCSGLIQNAWEGLGVPLPRDADMQEAFFADPAHGQVLWEDQGDEPPGWPAGLARGDLLFWPGHVALMVDGEHMIHANATHMAVTVDDAKALSDRWLSEKGLRLARAIRPKV